MVGVMPMFTWPVSKMSRTLDAVIFFIAIPWVFFILIKEGVMFLLKRIGCFFGVHHKYIGYGAVYCHTCPKAWPYLW